MTGTLAHRAEIFRLARVFGVEPEELDFLEAAPTGALAELRNAVLDRLLEHSRDEFGRAVALSTRLPRNLAASIGRRAMGPVISGRAAALLTPEMAADMAPRFPPEYLAEVAQHVDLRHVGPLIGGIPSETMAAVGHELRAQEEWIVLAAFVAHVPLPKLEALLAEFDGEALLRAGFVLEDVDRFDPLLALLPGERLDELVQVAHDLDLWAETTSIAIHLGPVQRNRVVDHLPDERIDELLTTAHREELWSDAIEFSSRLGPLQGDRVIAAIDRMEQGALEALAAALRGDPELRAAGAELIARAPAHLVALLDAAPAG